MVRVPRPADGQPGEIESEGCSGNLDATFASVRGKSPISQVYGDAVLLEHKANNTKSSCSTAKNCAPAKCLIWSRVFPDAQTLGPSSPVDVGVIVQQPYTQYWSQFYSSEPPPGYTAVPNA